jgi:inositol transport system substrate-binding protein
MKKFLSVLLLVVLVASMFAGCAPKAEPAAEAPADAPAEAPAEEVVKIGVCIPNFDDTFLVYMMDGMKEYAATLGDKVEVTYVDAKEDSAMQLSQVENFVIQGVDVIVVVPANTESVEPMNLAAAEAGIPLVYVNRFPAVFPEDAVFVGSQSIDAGIFQMEAVAELMGNEGNVVIMLGQLGHEAQVMRTEGNKQIAAKHEGINIIKEQTAKWQRAEGMSLMENWLSSGDQIDAVVCNNDDMALGAIQALEAQGILDDVIVAGVDATPDAISAMDEGKLDVTVFQDAAGQGGGGIEAAYKIAMGESVEREVWIPFQLVTPENVADFK